MIEGSTVYTLAPLGRGMGCGETTHYKIGLAGRYAIGIYIGKKARNFIFKAVKAGPYQTLPCKHSGNGDADYLGTGCGSPIT